MILEKDNWEWGRYNGGSGDLPKINDFVEVVGFPAEHPLSGIKGVLAGWSSIDETVAIVVVNRPLPDWRRAVCIPVVHLSPLPQTATQKYDTIKRNLV